MSYQRPPWVWVLIMGLGFWALLALAVYGHSHFSWPIVGLMLLIVAEMVGTWCDRR